VSVWVSGIGWQVEVFFGYAQEADLDWRATMRMPSEVDREANRLDMLADAISRDPLVVEMQKALPLGLWAAYRTRYHWQPAFEGLEPPKRIGDVQYLNGERDDFDFPLNPAMRKASRAVPRAIGFAAQEAGRSRAYDVTFDEKEMLAVFPRLGRNDTPLELVFQYRPELDESVVRLRNARESVTLEHATIKKFATEE